MAEPRLTGLVLDSVAADLEVEREEAERVGATVDWWAGDDASLASADFVLHVRRRVDAELIARLTSCRAIGRYGTGLDSVELDAARARGIPVVGISDYATDEVADHALALALAVARGVALPWDGLGDVWRRLGDAPALGLMGPIGVVGGGAIGMAVADRFAALGHDVLVASRRPLAAGVAPAVRRASIDELLAAAEVVSLHVALTPETRGMIGPRELGLMRPDAILVNTARAGLVDGPALVEALRTGRLRGAGLDAFEGDDGAALWTALHGSELNVVLTPHIGWYSPASAWRLRTLAVRDTVAAARAR
jgi:D-3-phosphoglycerate dehydrogenase